MRFSLVESFLQEKFHYFLEEQSRGTNNILTPINLKPQKKKEIYYEHMSFGYNFLNYRCTLTYIKLITC